MSLNRVARCGLISIMLQTWKRVGAVLISYPMNMRGRFACLAERQLSLNNWLTLSRQRLNRV
jgi:hypothetical protein